MSRDSILSWYVLGAIAIVAIAWLAAIIHASGHAPIGLVSLGVGIALGAALGVLAKSLRLAGGRQLIIGAIVLSILAVLAEHAWLYRDFRGQWHEARAKSPEVALFRPETPWSPREYFKHEFTPARAALWVADAAIIGVAAVGAVMVLQRDRK